MCTDEQHRQKMQALKDIHDILIGREPIDSLVQISATQPYVVDYKERKHVFLWLPSSAITLKFEDYGSGTVQAQVWTNLGMPAGIKVTAPNNSSTTPIMVRCTDEDVP